jgi:hypothetical protein
LKLLTIFLLNGTISYQWKRGTTTVVGTGRKYQVQTAFESAITTAQSAFDSATTQAELDSAVNALQSAITVFTTAVTNNGPGTIGVNLKYSTLIFLTQRRRRL